MERNVLQSETGDESITILQIRYGYLQPIAILNLVSNHRPGKCDFEAINRANP